VQASKAIADSLKYGWCGAVAKQAVWRDKQIGPQIACRPHKKCKGGSPQPQHTASEKPHFSQRTREMGHPALHIDSGAHLWDWHCKYGCLPDMSHPSEFPQAGGVDHC
jgi:hypothetical protein